MSGSSPVAGKSVRVTFDGGRLAADADAGVLVLAGIERRLGIAERLAHSIEDPRAPERVHHTVVDMIPLPGAADGGWLPRRERLRRPAVRRGDTDNFSAASTGTPSPRVGVLPPA